MKKLLASVTASLLVITGAQSASAGSIFDETYNFLRDTSYDLNKYSVGGFLGLKWEDILESSDHFYIDDANPKDVSGYTDDAYDNWGYLFVSDDDFATYEEILLHDYSTCVATDDGRPDRRPDDDKNHHSSLHCYSQEMTISGEKVRFELFHEFVGSFVRTSVTPMEGNELTGSLDFAFVGEHGYKNPTLEMPAIDDYSSSAKYNQVVISDRVSSSHRGVVGFRSDEEFSIFNATSDSDNKPTTNAYQADVRYFTFMFDDVISSTSGITVENMIVDYNDGDASVTRPAAIDLAKDLIDDIPFGFCIASVEDATPDATNQCTDKYWAAINSILIKPQRIDQSGFPGLWVNLDVLAGFGPDAPIFPLQTIDAGQKNDAVDEFGYLHITNGTNTHQLTLEDFSSCDAKADGESTRAVSNQGVDQFVIDCTGANVTLGSDTVNLDALIEIKGSSVAWQVDLSSTTDTAPISVWLEGLLGLEGTTTTTPMVYEFSDSETITTNVQQLVVSAEEEDDEIPVTAWEFNTPSTITTRDISVENSTPAVGEGDFGVLSESKVIGTDVETFRVELTTIDSYEDYDSYAVELAEEYLQDGYFGFCLPIVEQPLKPNMVDQCLQSANSSLNFREVEKRTQWDVDGKRDAVEGDSYLFADVTTRDGQSLDARVTLEKTVGLVDDLVEEIDDGSQARQSDWNDQHLKIDLRAETSFPEGTPKESYAQILIEFLDKSGKQVTLTDVYLNTYDIDGQQYFEAEGFDSYRLSENTSLTVIRGEGESLRFQGPSEGAKMNPDNQDDITNYRAEVYYQKASEVRVRLGTDVTDVTNLGNNLAFYFLDFSTGPFWVSAENIQGAAPQLQRNFAKPPPAFSAPVNFSGPIVTSVDPVEINARESFELIGERLDSVESVSAGNTELEILDSSDNKVLVQTDAGLAAATYELKINWSGGQLALSPELTVLESISAENTGPSVWTKKVSETEVKMYAKNVIGEGKIQFFVDGQEVAWIRAENEEDPKLIGAIGSFYLVRTIELDPGKNRLEIRVDGERVRFNTYTG